MNAHKGKNGYRDYLIEIRAYTGAEQLRKGNIENITAAELKKEVISRTRVFDFGGSGCWKNFALTQPGTYLVRICRNGSFNTIVNGVFLSDLSISPDQYRHAHNQAMPPPCTSFSLHYFLYHPQHLPQLYITAGNTLPTFTQQKKNPYTINRCWMLGTQFKIAITMLVRLSGAPIVLVLSP